jgi:hypothetical protein
MCFHKSSSHLACSLLAVSALFRLPTPPAPPRQSLRRPRHSRHDTASTFFRQAAQLSPERPDICKNPAYTLPGTGDSESARVQFGEAFRIDPAGLHDTLEYAFLCFEARDEARARKAEARRIFAGVRDRCNRPAISKSAPSSSIWSPRIDRIPTGGPLLRKQHPCARSHTARRCLSRRDQLFQRQEARSS